MFTRLLAKPLTSTLILGPRATGKSTWIKSNFPDVTYYDLLDSSEFLRLSKQPELLYQETHELPTDSWVVIDEIQKVPALLNEVQRLIENLQLKFILSGSSARKLKHGHANLLAGRALMVQMFPLVSKEIDFKLDYPDYLTYGSLPLTIVGADPQSYLHTYVGTYLQEEIKAEALAKNYGAFARFLEIAARQNGQVTNVSSIARDAGVARQTVQGYFDILVDTLIGFWLPAWKLKTTNKQVASPKFYFFDTGVVRALQNRLPYPPLQEELGFLLETHCLNELRAFLSYHKLYYPLHFWSSPDKVEVDIIFETPEEYIAIEIKAAENWERKFNRGLIRLKNEITQKPVKCFGIYMGKRAARVGDVKVHPYLEFLKMLWGGDIVTL